MPEITTSEYLNSLLGAWQNAEKIYSQAVSDVVAAEIRRDEARKARDEAFSRLEEARGRFSAEGENDSERKLTKSASYSKKGVGRGSSFKKSGLNANGSFNRSQPSKTSSAGSLRSPKSSVNKSPSFRKQLKQVNQSPGSQSNRSPAQKSQNVEPKPIPKAQNLEPKPITDTIVLSPRPNPKKAPKIFRKSADSKGASDISPRRTSLKVAPQLIPLLEPVNVLDIAKGHPREWYDQQPDWNHTGLVHNFYKAAFGTMTNEKTKQFSVITILMNDDWNDLVTSTSEIQSMYIGKNTDPDAKPTLRDKAAKALVRPPQREPVALFFAPKKKMGTNHIYYGGHWKVVDGDILHPPRDVKGQPRQALVKFQCVGISQAIVNALNGS